MVDAIQNPAPFKLMYKNPSDNVLSITNPFNRSMTFQLFNNQGQALINRKMVPHERFTENIHHLPNSVYFITAYTSKERFSGKLVINH